jgi:hypothetical protein
MHGAKVKKKILLGFAENIFIFAFQILYNNGTSSTKITLYDNSAFSNTGLLKIIVGVLTTCHVQYT